MNLQIYWKIGDKATWADLMEWAQSVRAFLSCVNVHQTANTADKAPNNHLDKVTHYVFVSESLCSAILVIAKKADEPIGHRSRHGSHAWTEQHGFNSLQMMWL